MPPDNITDTTSEPPDMRWLSATLEQELYPLAGRAVRWFAGLAAVLCALALYIAFFVLPSHFAYGEHYRILLIHIPATWMAVLIYLAMAVAVGLNQIVGHRLFSTTACALAPTGAMFAFLALWTGSLWGKPTWGVWWVWDARLTGALLMLLLFLGFVAVQSAMEDRRRADRAGGAMIIAGLLILPLLHLTVGGSGMRYGFSAAPPVPPGLADTAHVGMWVMTAGLVTYTIAATLTRLRVLILERERHSEWVMQLAGEKP